MEECDDVSEDTNQQQESPSQGQPPPEQVPQDKCLKPNKAEDQPPPADDAGSKQREDNAIATSHNSASDESAERPWSVRRRQPFRSSLETIIEGKTTTSFRESVVKAGKLENKSFSPHDLVLAETTESMVALTSQTSLHSLVSAASASVHTIFQTPDWVEDDSDNKFSPKTDLPAKRLTRERIVNSEVASSTQDKVKADVETPTRDMSSVQMGEVAEGAQQTAAAELTENSGLTTEPLLEPQETFDLSHFNHLASNVQRDSSGKDSGRSAIEELEFVLRDVCEFDPLMAPALPPPTLASQPDTKIADTTNMNLVNDLICVAPVLTPIVLMPVVGVTNLGIPDLQKNASTPQDNDDMIQFDDLQENVKLIEESGHSATTEPCNKAEKVDHTLKSLPNSPIMSPGDLDTLVDQENEPAQKTAAPLQIQVAQNSELPGIQEDLGQLKEHRDTSRVEHIDAKFNEVQTANESPLSTTKELKSAALNEDLTSEAKSSLLTSPISLLMRVEDLDEPEYDIDRTNGSQDQILAEGKNLPEGPNESATKRQNVEILTQGIDQISFKPKAIGKTGNFAAQDIRLPVLNDPGQTFATRSHQVQRDCKDNTNTASTSAQGRNNEFETEPVKANSDVHQLRKSYSSLLQDFYNMRKMYTNEPSFGFQSIARTVAERDRPVGDLISFADSRHRLGSEIELQSKRIDSAINLMDATIEEIQKWQTKKVHTPPERDIPIQATPASNDAATVSKGGDPKKVKPPEIVRSSTVPSTPGVGRGRPANKPGPGNVLKRETKTTRAEASRTVRPLTSHVPNRNQEVSGQGRGGKASSPPRRDFLAGQEKQPTGDATNRRVQPLRLNINLPTSRLQTSPSTRNVKTPATKSARTFQPLIPEDNLSELKKCTLTPASYLERCLALTQLDVGRARRSMPQQDNPKQPVLAKRTPMQSEIPNKAVKSTKPEVRLATAGTKDGQLSKVDKPKEMLVPQKLTVDDSNKDTNVPLVVIDEPAVKEGTQENTETKPKNRFLSDDDIEKWVRLSTRYARCAEMGASLFKSKHSCDSDKETVKSDGTLVKTASDMLMDTLMDTVTSAVKKTSRAKAKPAPSMQPTTKAAKDILSRLSVGNTTCITQLKTEDKVTRSIDNLVRSMSKIVDSTSDKRVCWDSSRDSRPTTPAEQEAGLDEVRDEIVEKSRQVVEKMTDTLIKELTNHQDELDFKTADHIEPVTQISMDDLRNSGKVETSAESLKRWTDTKTNQLEVILSRLMQTNSTTSTWGLTSLDADGIPESVKNSQHKLATLENIVALLNSINKTCKIRENNVEWDDPAYAPRPPSMAPLPAKSKRSQKSSNHSGSQRKDSSNAKSDKKFVSLSDVSTKGSSKSSAHKQERLSYCDTCDEKLRNPPSPPKSNADSRHSDESKVQERRSRPTSQTPAKERPPSVRTLDSQRSASSSSRRFSYCEACNEKARKSSKDSDGKQQRRSSSNASAGSRTSQGSVTRDRDPRRPSSRRSDSSRFSYCDTCNDKRQKAKSAEERGETTVKPTGRLSSVTSNRIRDRSLSPPVRSGRSISSGSSNTLEGSASKGPRFSYCDTCDEKRRKESLAKERGEIENKRPKTSACITSVRSRSPSPSVGRWSSVSSTSSLEDVASRSSRFSYCDTCNEKRRQESLAKERGEIETKRPRRSASITSGRSRSQSPPSRRWSSVSSTSSVEDGTPRRPRYSYCDTCDEKLRKQTPPATPLKNHDGGSVVSWRSESSQYVKSTLKVSFSAPLETFENEKESASQPRKESSQLPRQAAGERPSTWTKERGSQGAKKTYNLRESDSLMSHLSATLSRDSSSDNYSSATFIISDRPMRSSRVDLAMPKIRHVEGTKSTYSHVLQKAFMDRLDNIIKVQTATSRPNLSSKPSATSNTSMARYTLKKTERSSTKQNHSRNQIPSATEIRSRMRRCCERMPSKDIFGAKINRESIVRKCRQRIGRESENSLRFLDEISDVEDFVWKSMTPVVCTKAFSTTYAGVIQRERPLQGTTKISSKIQSFIEQDLSSWHKITNDRIQSVRKDESFFPFEVSQSSVLESESSRFNVSEENLLQALVVALGGSPRTNPSLMPSIEPDRIAKETVKAMRKNKKYRQRDTLEEDEVVIPIGDLCSSETLFRTINVVMKTDTDATISPAESRTSTDYDVEYMTSSSNIDLVLKSVKTPSSSQSIRNVEIFSTSSATDCVSDASSTCVPEGHHVLENVAQFTYSPSKNDSVTSSAVSSSDLETEEISKLGEMPESEKYVTASESQDFEIVGAKSGDQELKNDSQCSSATSEGDMPTAENTAGPESVRMTTNIHHASVNTASFSASQASESIHSTSQQVHGRLFSRISKESSEYQHQSTDGKKKMKEGSFYKMNGDLINSSNEDSKDSYCSIAELLERYEMAIPFQHERLAVETSSGMSIPIVDAVNEDTWGKLAHAISHLPQESIPRGDEVFSRLHHPNIPPDVRADLDHYNECLDDETLYQNQKLGNRSRKTREGICGIRQTKSLLDDTVHETKVTKEVSFWSEDADGIVSASGDTDVDDPCSNSDGLSLIANVSTDVFVTDSVTDESLNVSCASILTRQSSASTSKESLVTTSDDTLDENAILASLLDQINTRSQLDLLNSRLDGVVRREQLAEEVVEPRVVEWRGASTISALCVTFGAVIFGAVMGLPNLWE